MPKQYFPISNALHMPASTKSGVNVKCLHIIFGTFTKFSKAIHDRLQKILQKIVESNE